MKKTILVIVMSICILTNISFSGENTDSAIYTVKPGDTLWAISEANFNDPFKWQQLWKKNSHIKNPHLIFPGQKIFLTDLSIERSDDDDVATSSSKKFSAKRRADSHSITIMSQTLSHKAIQSKERSYLVPQNIFLKGAIVSDDSSHIGKIASSLSGRTVLGFNEDVVIDSASLLSDGEVFWVASPHKPIFSDSTKSLLGYVLEIKGKVKIKSNNDKMTLAKIVESYKEILMGDILIPIKAFDAPLAPLNINSHEINKAYIVDTASGSNIIGRGDIVYINKGLTDNIAVGNVYAVKSKLQPFMNIAFLQIVSVANNLSSAIIIKSVQETQVGDIVAKIEKF